MKVIKLWMIFCLCMNGIMFFGSERKAKNWLDRSTSKLAKQDRFPEDLDGYAKMFEDAVSDDDTDPDDIKHDKAAARYMFGKLRVVPQNEVEQNIKDIQWGFWAFKSCRVTRWAATKRLHMELEKYKKEYEDEKAKGK